MLASTTSWNTDNGTPLQEIQAAEAEHGARMNVHAEWLDRSQTK